ncbi:MAG: hypothetical protein WHT06_07055 [Desulfobacterales bacterium]
MSRRRPLLLLAGAVACALGSALSVAAQEGRPPASPPAAETARQKQLERDASVNLSLAKRAIQEEGFANGRVALNVWKVTAIEADAFDARLYEELRRQLYEKSLRESLRCVEQGIAHRNTADAVRCLQLYRHHAQEIRLFDARRYEELNRRISEIRTREKR